MIGTEPAPCTLLSLVEMCAHYPDHRDWKREVLLHTHPAYLGKWELVQRWMSVPHQRRTARLRHADLSTQPDPARWEVELAYLATES